MRNTKYRKKRAESNCRSEIFNTGQGSRFSCAAFTGMLRNNGLGISMDEHGRREDNVFTGSLWRSLKFEEVYLHAYESCPEPGPGLAVGLRYYHN